MKTIRIQDSTWKKLSILKLKYNLKTMDNLINSCIILFEIDKSKEKK
jgi:hypothetical protein